MKLFKKKNWAFYLFRFIVLTLAFFFVALLFDIHNLRAAIISGLVSGVVFSILWWFLDQAHGQIQDSVREDEAERKKAQS